MQEKFLECQGLSCPQPVLKCKEAVDSGAGRLRIVVDNEPAKENVCRFLGTKNFEILGVNAENGEWTILAQPGDNTDSSPDSFSRERDEKPKSSPTPEGKTLVFITQDKIGHGDDELGTKLMHNFLATLPEMGEELWRVILLNGGVRLAIEDNPALKSLQALLQNGVSILVCGTCLDFFDLLEHKEVGETTNMLDVVTSLQLADKVISV